MTRLFPVLLALLFLSACASSADTARDEDRVARTLASMDEALDLTDRQAEQVRGILVAQEARRPPGPSRGGQGEQGGPPRGDRDAQRAEADRQIEAVLTPEQVDLFRTWRAAQPTPQGLPPRGR